MVTLTPRPRADYALGGSLGFSATNLSGWGRQIGEGQGKTVAPETLNPSRNWDPINALLFGQRGSFKTTITTALCKIYDAAFWDKSLGKQRGFRRVCGNYWMRFAQDRGPIGFKRGLIELPDGGVAEGWIPVDPCYQGITDDIKHFPTWGMHRLIAIDEWADVLPSGGAGTRNTRDWGSVLRQQRSMFNEFLGSTQKPWQIAQSQILTQIDLLILIKPHKATYSADLLVWDWQGQFTGNYGKKIKFPPQEGTHDWEMGISDLNAVFGDFNTYEIIAPSWADAGTKAALVERQYRNRATWATAEHAIIEAGPEDEQEATETTEPQSSIVPAEILEPAERALYMVGRKMPFTEARRAVAPILGAAVRSAVQLTEWLEQHGWTVYTDKISGERMVQR